MRYLWLVPLFWASYCQAQTDPSKPELTPVEAYQLSIRYFLKDHMSLTYDISTPPGKIVFIRKQDFTDNFPDTIGGVLVKFIDPGSDVDTIARYVSKKKKLHILGLQAFMLRESTGSVWIMPMTGAFNARKKTLHPPGYEGSGCQYLFDYALGNKSHLIYKETVCKEF